MTTHWAWCDALAAAYPSVTVDPDPIFVADGPIRTSAGVTAGMDLALALVEEDLGPQRALEVARNLVLFVRRPGGQSQFSAGLRAQAATRAPLRELQAWIVGQPGRRPRRQRARRARAHERAPLRPRVQGRDRAHARRLRRAACASSAHGCCSRAPRRPVDAVAAQCGFGTVETLRRAFARRVGVSPVAYRERFAA